MVQGKDYTSKVDIWSAGVLLYILMSGTVPFIDENQQQLFRKIAEAKYVLEGDDWDHVSDHAKQMIRSIMHKDPAQRLSAGQALELPWVSRPHAELDQHHMPNVQERLDLYACKMKLPITVFEPGTVIIRQGERATDVYLIRKGEVEVYFEEADENSDVVKETRVAVRGEGDFVGEMGVIVNEKGDMLLHRAATFREGHSTRRLAVLARPPGRSRRVPARSRPRAVGGNATNPRSPPACHGPGARAAVEESGETGAQHVPRRDCAPLSLSSPAGHPVSTGLHSVRALCAAGRR